MRYSWDEEKARRNLALHGIAFEDAVRIFEGSTLERVDERFDYDERRVYAIGVVNGLEITVIYTDREGRREADHLRVAIGAARKTPLLAKPRGFEQLRPDRMNTKRSKPKPRAGTDWARLRRMSAGSIRKGIAADPDVHGTDEEFWKGAQVVMPTPKEIVTMRLDADLLRWFRQHRGYQTRINAILRAYMNAHGSV